MTRPEKVTTTPLKSTRSHTGELTERAERRRLLREELDRYQGESGAFTEAEMAEARALLYGIRETGDAAQRVRS